MLQRAIAYYRVSTQRQDARGPALTPSPADNDRSRMCKIRWREVQCGPLSFDRRE